MSTARVDEIVSFCDELLDVHSFDDWSPNGIQVFGAEETGLVATGVTARIELFEQAREAGAGLLIVHHGILHGAGGPIDRLQGARLRTLLESGMALAQYHLPLDGHRSIGNAALLAEAIGATVIGGCCEVRGRDAGVLAEFAGGVTADDLLARVTAACGREPLAILAGPETIGRAAIATGAAAGEVTTAAALGLDALITGEPAEHAVPLAEEAGVHLICAGHHASETFGVRRLGELVAERFGVEQAFFDIPNPV